VRLLGREGTAADELTRPGHVVPLRARAGGVLERPGHTEAAVDLCRLAGLTPVAAIAELVDDRGEMLRGPQVRELGAAHGLPVIAVADLVAWRQRHDRVARVATTVLPTRHGPFTAHGYRDLVTGAEHLALVAAHSATNRPPVVRVHSECLTGDALGSARCDCGAQLDDALARVAVEGGTVVYLRGHEGRGVGLLDKLRAYAVQDTGLDTVDAQTHLGLPVDAREYGAAAAVLRDLGMVRVRLLTHNPGKVRALEDGGVTVAEVLPGGAEPAPESARYRQTKRARLGHATLPVTAGTTDGRTG
jgi:3,4-dihydroxy 2-butanone 4-phosphate synthase/GTP cyclohydrolase II